MDRLLQKLANVALQDSEPGVFSVQLDLFGHMLNRQLTNVEEIIVPTTLKSGFNS